MTDPKPMKKVAKDGHTYHKSSSANADTAPTNETTKANATKQGSLTAEELDFVTIVHYEFGLQGGLPSKDHLVEQYFYKPDVVEKYYASEAVKTALEERGIELRPKF